MHDLKDYILVSGFAQTPKGIPANETYKYIGVILLINRHNHTIEKVDFSIVFSNLTKEVLSKYIVGYCVKDSFHDFSIAIRNSIVIPSIGAILQAIRAAIDRYNEHLKRFE